MNRKYNLRLDLQFRCNNSVMKFRQSDNKTSDFFMRITSGGELFDIDNAIAILAVIKPNQSVQSQILEVVNGKIYADLESNMKDQVGTYKAQALLIYEDERVSTDVIEYEVTEDNILNQLETAIQSTNEFTMLQEMLSRLSAIEQQEQTRIDNENNRLEAEKSREQAIKKIKNDIEELISQTNKKVEDNLKTNTSKIDTLVTDTKKELNEYKESKDTELEEKLSQYKKDTTRDIEDYKNLKNDEIDKAIKSIPPKEELVGAQGPKGDTGATGPQGIQGPKGDTGAQGPIGLTPSITHLENKVNEKMREVDAAEQQRQEDHQSREEFLNSFESQLEQIENKNIEQDNRLKQVEYKNKVQDVYINGLFNENNDKRLTIEGEGNSLKLEGSKEGLVTVDKVVGDTLVILSNNVSIRDSRLSFWYENLVLAPCSMFKENTEYTLIYTIKITNDTSNGAYNTMNIGLGDSVFSESMPGFSLAGVKNGVNIIKFIFNNPNSLRNIHIRPIRRNTAPIDGEYIDYSAYNFIILEGDYTNKPIPSEYFEGMQSTFENQLVTQEMVDSGEESVENLGKYKCDVKVRGKNLFDINSINFDMINYTTDISNGSIISAGNYALDSSYHPINCNDMIVYSGIYVGVKFAFYDSNFNYLGWSWADKFRLEDSNMFKLVSYYRISLYTAQTSIETFLNGSNQLEEGTQATPYEPYYERTQTVYLNSPLLKGDEIVCKEDGLYHYHKMGQDVITDSANMIGMGLHESVVNLGYGFAIDISNGKDSSAYSIINDKGFITNGASVYMNQPRSISIHQNGKLYFSLTKADLGIDTIDIGLNSEYIKKCKQWLQANPVTVVYELAEPYYEKISDEQIVLEIPNNATLSVESAIPCQSISASYTGGIPSLYGMENDITTLQDTSVDIIATSWDTDYRLSEVEWALEDSGILAPMLVNINTKNIKGGNTMALTKFEQAKIMILGGAYNRATLTKQLSRYLEKGVITQSEYDELIALMDAKELVTGE